MNNFKKLVATTTCSALLVCGISFSDNQKLQQSQVGDELDIELISEAFGHFIGRNLRSPGADFDLESVIKGIRDGATGSPAPMSDQDYEISMTKLQERAFETMARENLEAANAFLQKNNLEQGVVELDPGKLQYVILEQGSGETVEQHSAPLIHYTGKYLDGTIFGCSEETGGPITIPLDQTIPGFSKGMLGMKQGEKRRLFIHPDLGYGTLGNLPPNALLVFDIEIIKANAEEDSSIGSTNSVEEDFALLEDDGDSGQETNLPDPDDMEQKD